MKPAVRILGVDPGSNATGYAVLEVSGSRTRALDHGVIRMPREPLPARLKTLHERLSAIVRLHQPHEVAVEQVFTAVNVKSALVLGHARGAVLLAVASVSEVYEYSPRAVKKAVVGYGQADKQQVARMITSLLSLSEVPAQDAADALAIALCHAHMRTARGLYEVAR